MMFARVRLQRRAKNAVAEKENRRTASIGELLVCPQQRHRIFAFDELSRKDEEGLVRPDAERLAHRLTLAGSETARFRETLVVHGPRQQKEVTPIGAVVLVVRGVELTRHHEAGGVSKEEAKQCRADPAAQRRLRRRKAGV